jgi:hypothetical protein
LQGRTEGGGGGAATSNPEKKAAFVTGGGPRRTLQRLCEILKIIGKRLNFCKLSVKMNTLKMEILDKYKNLGSCGGKRWFSKKLKLLGKYQGVVVSGRNQDFF